MSKQEGNGEVGHITCPKCGQQFFTVGDLADHIREIHSKD